MFTQYLFHDCIVWVGVTQVVCPLVMGFLPWGNALHWVTAAFKGSRKQATATLRAESVSRAMPGGCHSQSGSERDLGNKPGLGRDRGSHREQIEAKPHCLHIKLLSQAHNKPEIQELGARCRERVSCTEAVCEASAGSCDYFCWKRMLVSSLRDSAGIPGGTNRCGIPDLAVPLSHWTECSTFAQECAKQMFASYQALVLCTRRLH